MAPPNDELRRLLHALREPLGAFAINIDLLGKLRFENKELKIEAEKYLEVMRAQLLRARTALDDMDFILENGHARSPQPSTEDPRSPQS